ncbi:MAG: HDOD domain-containing protein [Gammaproteobacteria bacterium]|nr:HDOD domain-containing protein [Gammaproteobacteria bacterium]
MHNIAIGRQPVYDRQLQVVGYELLYRQFGGQNQANFNDGNKATSEVILNALTEIGIKTLVGDVAPFINITTAFLTGEVPMPELPRDVVIEILEDIPVTENTLSGMRRFLSMGYRIALDDFTDKPEMDPFIEMANIIKIDIMQLDQKTVKQLASRFKEQRKKILAEKVETYEDFEFCKSLGFDYYQGYFFCKPEIINSHTLPVNKLKVLQILASLHDPTTNASRLENEISTDVTLSYRLLRYINSVQYYLQKDIDSIKQAVLLLGWDNIRSISTLLLIAQITDKPFELFKTGMVRAKMCEILGTYLQPKAKEIFFTAGLLSVIDALMDMRMENVMEQLPLSDELSTALIKQEGIIGEVLNLVIDYVHDTRISQPDLFSNPDTISEAYMMAIQWADSTLAKLDRMDTDGSSKSASA